MTTKGIIYFIQPAELVGTNRYKIGCSANNDLVRCKTGYKKRSRYYLNYKILLKNADNEYFEADENKTYFVNYFETNKFFFKYFCSTNGVMRTFIKCWKIKEDIDDN